jgi:hypothetical protein
MDGAASVDIRELAELLRSRGVPSDAYCLGADRDETYCLLFEDGRWHVYYSHRGLRGRERVFDDQAAACQELLDVVSNDHIVRSLLRRHWPDRAGDTT